VGKSGRRRRRLWLGVAGQWGAIRQLPSGGWQAEFTNPDSVALTPAPETFLTKRAANEWLAAKQADLDRPLRDRVIATNPALLRKKSLPRRPMTDRPVLSPTDIERLAQAMRHKDDQTLVRLLGYGGLRIGEALALRRRDLDPARSTLTIQRSVEDVKGHLSVGRSAAFGVADGSVLQCLRPSLRQLQRTRSCDEEHRAEDAEYQAGTTPVADLRYREGRKY